MNRLILMISLIAILGVAHAQEADYLKEIKVWQEDLNKEYLDPVKSPLSKKERKDFTGHLFYPVQESYRVKAKFEPTPDSKPFQLATSTGGAKIYKRIGILHFELLGENRTLEAYVEQKRFSLPGMPTYVFLPLVDETTGNETYGGGRYMHYEGIPEGTIWTVDFNKLYNPYCAYNDKYECPKVPDANYLPIKVESGIKGY
ncbi:DUF1684 domain-containing protein [uncultured Roseivirga sp.]|uniref:DUF1684 domain-containing protein n=1 Tax=uncultured Roseivirga sp. TaxID=543088 RepID=UPI002589E7ED|nr:DUF1684 domain-containing protein [uncultured Roseivirga sp.]